MGILNSTNVKKAPNSAKSMSSSDRLMPPEIPSDVATAAAPEFFNPRPNVKRADA